MEYAKTAAKVIEYVGGKNNIKSVAHCATRLRFQLRDNSLRNEEAISDLEGVKGVFLTQSQFQIIFGSGLVNLICAEVQKQLGIEESPDSASLAEPEEKRGNALQRFVKLLSDIFVPIIPAIVAGGLLMGINNLLTSGLIHGQSVIELYPQWQGLAAAINLFASAPFTFLPVLIGFSAAKKFGGNPFLGAAMGMIMVHPDLLNAYSIGVAEPPMWDIFGLEIAAIGYQGTVLPVLAVSWILATLEKKLHKITPTWLDNLTTPMISILATSFLTFLAVGPVLREAGNLLAEGITWLYNTLGFVGGGIFGLAYAPITSTGMHHSFIAIETQLIADYATTGGSFIFSTASMNNVAQGAAVLAVLLLTKNEKMKSILLGFGSICTAWNHRTCHVWRYIKIKISILCSCNRFRCGKRLSGSDKDAGTGLGSSWTSWIYLYETGPLSGVCYRYFAVHGSVICTDRGILEEISTGICRLERRIHWRTESEPRNQQQLKIRILRKQRLFRKRSSVWNYLPLSVER